MPITDWDDFLLDIPSGYESGTAGDLLRYLVDNGFAEKGRNWRLQLVRESARGRRWSPKELKKWGDGVYISRLYVRLEC
jgi:hypothetical protein